MMKAVLPAMRQQVGGKIINVSSGVVEIGFPFMPYYTASKCALEGVSRVARQELKPFGISVCVVQPGFTKTEIDTAIVTGEDSKGLYEPRCTAWMEAYRKAIQAGQDPSAVAHCISRILSNPKPGFLYFAGAEVRIGGLLKKLLPEDLFYWALSRIYRVHV